MAGSVLVAATWLNATQCAAVLWPCVEEEPCVRHVSQQPGSVRSPIVRSRCPSRRVPQSSGQGGSAILADGVVSVVAASFGRRRKAGGARSASAAGSGKGAGGCCCVGAASTWSSSDGVGGCSAAAMIEAAVAAWPSRQRSPALRPLRQPVQDVHLQNEQWPACTLRGCASHQDSHAAVVVSSGCAGAATTHAAPRATTS